MRLTLKLTIALTVILIFQFALYSYLVAQRLTGFFERDIKRDALQIGRTLATAVGRTWKNQGKDEALALISETNDDYAEIQIRFVWLSENVEVKLRPDLPLSDLTSLEKGKFFVKRVYPDPESDYIYTYIRVPLEEEQQGAIELKQSFAPESRFTTISVLRALAFLFIVVSTTALVMWLLGYFFIGRPIRRLCEKARRIGQGDLSDHIEVKGSDEIALLSHEINQMNDALAESRKRVEEETAAKLQAVGQLRHADRLTTIGTLASGVAHELGTPLTVVSGNVTSLASKTDPDVQKATASISEQIEKMSAIIRQLLNFSRRRTLDRKSLNLQELLDRVIKMLTPFGEKRRVSIQYFPSTHDAIVEVDGTQIEQVLTNLIVNAMQAMETGEVEVGFTTEMAINPESSNSSSRSYYCIYIKDFGRGMTEEEAKQIFDPFFTTKSPGQGTGMGLSIAHGIVREHRGWIKVETELGKGSCFFVYLPSDGAE